MATIAMIAPSRGLPAGVKLSLRHYPALLNAIVPMTLPAVMLGGIWFGAFTPTEAAAIGGAYALLLGFLIFRS
jgi:TRAP-type C4-dicarboxylate transport system permease large subunit